jgi:RNA polymerase sigma-70 factor (ECF subfamily)
MARAQGGDAAAYATLLRAMAPVLRAYAARRLGEGPDAEDAVQEMLIAVHAIRHTYDPARPFGPWLLTIARRRVIDQLRRRSRRLAREAPEAAVERAEAADELGPLAATIRLVEVRAVRAAVAGLPPRQREAVRLLRLEQLPLDEAATASGQSIGALKVACHRALKSLQRVLGSGKGRDRADD